MNEAKFWTQRVRKWLPPGAFAMRVENGLAAGTPDVFYCWRGRHGWIENKYRERAPVYSNTIVFPEGYGIRKEQRAWWIQYLRAGGVGLIIAGVGPRSFVWRASEDLVRNFNLLQWQEVSRAKILDADTLTSEL